MRMVLPGVRQRKLIDQLLQAFFTEHKQQDFNRAIAEICKYYKLKTPQVEWFEYLDWYKTAGRTYDNGTIHLVHPENWKRQKKQNSVRSWIKVVYHEFGHYIFWSDAERKADLFALKMVRGLKT